MKISGKMPDFFIIFRYFLLFFKYMPQLTFILIFEYCVMAQCAKEEIWLIIM